MSASAALAAYQRDAGETDPWAMLRRLELPIESMAPCVARAHELGLHAIVSVFSVELVKEAERLPWDAYKTASPDVVNRPLLLELLTTGRPLVVSTGAATLEEVARAVGWLNDARADALERVALLQCVSSYPTEMDLAELGGILALRRAFPAIEVGYSDHTTEETTGLEAVMLGATILEKHFTDDRGRQGPDHRASLDAKGFASYCEYVESGAAMESLDGGVLSPLIRAMRTSEGMHGVVAEKRVLAIEQDVRKVSRQSVTTTRDLLAGERVELVDLSIKRPGTGIPPWRLEDVVGRVLRRKVDRDRTLMAEDLEGFE
jgi:sialic acid synthase SpsE